MSGSKSEYYFLPGRAPRNSKAGVPGPGVLVINGQYKYKWHRVSKDLTKWTMYCLQKGNPEFSCKAKAIVIRREDGTFGLVNEIGDHNHTSNEAANIADEMRVRMKEIVKENPSVPVGEAVKKTKNEIFEHFGQNEQLLKDIISELGSKHALDQILLRERRKILGPMPKNRNDFNPKEILQSLYKEKANDIIIMDSNEMTDDWRKVIDKINTNSEYDFTNMDDLIKDHEDTIEEDIEE